MCVYQDLLIVSLCNAMRDKGGTDLLDNLLHIVVVVHKNAWMIIVK